MHIKLFFAILLSLSITTGFAQAIAVPFDSLRWQLEGQSYELTTYQNQDALLLRDASATLKDVLLQDGILEWDMAFSQQRGFSGIYFRVKDDRNAELFYLRPHQSGKPDANQYTPFDNGLTSWQLYTGEGYAAALPYVFDQWFHIKMVITGRQAAIFLNGATTPSINIPWLHHAPTAGTLQLYASRLPVYFANFTYQTLPSEQSSTTSPTPSQPDPFLIKSWKVSSPFSENDLNTITDLEKFDAQDLQWKTLAADPSGTTNLATVSSFQKDSANTVFAKLIINTNQSQIKGLQFGFSDRARIFCNGKLVFTGNDSYRTRDFRFLGTIGFHDTIYLPLRKGHNEIWIAVSESFGGWGIQGRWLHPLA